MIRNVLSLFSAPHLIHSIGSQCYTFTKTVLRVGKVAFIAILAASAGIGNQPAQIATALVPMNANSFPQWQEGSALGFCPIKSRWENDDPDHTCPTNLRPKEKIVAERFPQVVQRHRKSKKPKGLFFVAESDHNGALDPKRSSFDEISKLLADGYDLKFVEAQSMDEICQEIKDASESGAVLAVIINAHGSPYAIELSNSSYLTADQDFGRCLKPLDKSARILVLACSTAKPIPNIENIASVLARKGKRMVIAPTEDLVVHYSSIIRSNPLSIRMEKASFLEPFKDICQEFSTSSSGETRGCASEEDIFESIISKKKEDEGFISFSNDNVFLIHLVESAASKGDYETIQKVIASQRFKEVSVYGLFALEKAAENGHLKCLQALLDFDRSDEIARMIFGVAFREAAGNGHLDCVNALIHSRFFQFVDSNSIGWALEDAAKNNHLDCIKAIIATDRFSQIPINWLRLALWSSEKNQTCHQAILDALPKYLTKKIHYTR